MKKKQLGNSDMKFSVLGLGTWAIGGDDWSKGWGYQDDEVSIRTIHCALDLGINWIDTAAIYGLGHSEKVVGRAIKSSHSKPFIATKCGRKWSENDTKIYSDLKKESVIKEVEDSLRRLQIETIDLYQIHWPRPDEQIEEAWDAIHSCIKQGKIRYAGVSNFSPSQMKRLQKISPITSLQPPYSMIRPGIEEDILTFCHENQIGVICYSPLSKGILTKKFSEKWAKSRPKSDHRSEDPHFQEPELSINLWFTEALSNLITDTEYSLAHLAIAWTLRRKEVTSAIVGSRSPEQIEETVKSGEMVLTNELISKIDSLMKQRIEKINNLSAKTT